VRFTLLSIERAGVGRDRPFMGRTMLGGDRTLLQSGRPDLDWIGRDLPNRRTIPSAWKSL
jgi:hypothetical protein